MQQVLRGRSRRCLLLQVHLLHARCSSSRCSCRLPCRLFLCRRQHWLCYRQVVAKAEALQQELTAVSGKVGLQEGPGLSLLAALQLQAGTIPGRQGRSIQIRRNANEVRTCSVG